MLINFTLITGIKFGIEHCDLDDDDREAYEFEYTSLIVVDLGILRIGIHTGSAETEE